MSDAEDALAKGNVRRAVSCFEKEIELNPQNPAPRLRLALIYEHIYKDAARADEYYAQYLEMETREAKREMVERWREDLGASDEGLDLPPLPEDGAFDANSLSRQLADARRQLLEAERARDEFAGKIIELQGIQDRLAESQAAVADLTKEIGRLKARVDARDSSLADLKKEYDKLKAQGETAHGESAAEMADLEKQIADLTAANSALKTRNAELEEERSRSGRRSLADRLEEARAALKAAEKQNDAYASRIKTLEAKVARLEAGTGTASHTVTHVVKEGETLTVISLKYYGTKERWREIYDANRDALPEGPDKITPGQELTIPITD
jgi:DNA repair exonuclease SbcCD ATPase subunit